MIYLNSGSYSILVLAAVNIGLICLCFVTRLQPKRKFCLLVPSWGTLKTIFHSDSESLSAAPSREFSGTGEFSDGTESVCVTPDQEAYISDSGLLATQQDILPAPNKHTLHEDLDSPEIMGAASHLYNGRCILPHETTHDHGDTEHTLNQELRFCHDPASLDVSSCLKSSSSAGFKLVTHNAKPEDPCQPLCPVHLVRNSPPLVKVVSHEKARTCDSHRPAHKRDIEPRDGNLQMAIPVTPNHDGHLSVSSIQASPSSMVPKKRSWSHTVVIGTDLEEGAFLSQSPGDQSALGLSLPRSVNQKENRVTSRLSPTSRRENILQCDSLCHSEPTATPFEMRRQSATTPVPCYRGSQHSSNGLVVTEVERDDSPSSGSERKFDGPDSFWEAAAQERLRVTATFTTLEPLKPKGAGNTLIDLSQTTATDGDQPDRSLSRESAARSPPWSIVTRKASRTHSSPQQPNSGETRDQAPDDDFAPKSGTPGLASNQADSFPGLSLHSGAYAKYVPPQRRVAGELVYTVSQRTKPTPCRSERVKFGFSSPMLETRSRSSTLSPWSPFAPHEFICSTSEAVAWKRGALFLTNPPPDEFAHIDEFGNEKPCYPKTNWKTAEPADGLSGSLIERPVAGKRAVKDGEEGCQLKTHSSPQQHCHDMKNGHHRCETFGT